MQKKVSPYHKQRDNKYKLQNLCESKNDQTCVANKEITRIKYKATMQRQFDSRKGLQPTKVK